MDTYQNPVKRWRINEQITQVDMAWDLNVTRQVVTNLESGLYLSLPESVTDLSGISQDEYQHWIHYQRQQNSRFFRDKYHENMGQNWLQFKWSVRPDRSDRGFCRLLVYQPSVLRLYEQYGQSANQLRRALSDVNVPSEVIGKLVA